MEGLDFRVIMHMQALIKKEISPSRMEKYYSGEILLCGVLRRYVSQNIVWREDLLLFSSFAFPDKNKKRQ